MAKVTFSIRQGGTAKDCPIYLVYRFGRNDKYRHNTGLRIAPKNWNSKTYRPRPSAPNSNLITDKLNQLETAVTKFILEQQTSGQPVTPYNLKTFILSLASPHRAQVSDFLDFVQEFADNADKRTNPATGLRVSDKNIYLFKRLNKRLKEFADLRKHYYTFTEIDFTFYNDFTDFLRTKFNYSTNTIGQYIKALKTILTDATIKGKPTNPIYRSPKFKVITEESEQVYLSYSELEQMLNTPLRGASEQVRDMFIIGAYTGLRFSDFSRMTATAIQGQNIRLIQQKTGQAVTIPIHPIVAGIWYKYKGNLPAPISVQKFNQYIKEVARLAGIDTPITTHITKGGKRLTQTQPKYNLISTHTARRSFATNLFKSGFPSISIMQITGHRTEKAFLKYIKITQEENAQLLRNFWEHQAQQQGGQPQPQTQKQTYENQQKRLN